MTDTVEAWESYIPLDLSTDLSTEETAKLDKLNTAMKKQTKDKLIEIVYRLSEHVGTIGDKLQTMTASRDADAKLASTVNDLV